jgi:hypothetical protein
MNALSIIAAKSAAKYLYRMQKVVLLCALLAATAAGAQSLTVASMDSIAYVNSHNGIQATAHVSVANTSNASKDYVVVRRKVGTTGLVDSNYFCWDLCYPVWANQSQGTVTIGAGSTANDFSGYAYVRDTSANGQDTIWYTFINAADATDSLQVQVVYGFNRYVASPESEVPVMQLYPSPARGGTRMFGLPSNAVRVEWVDALGRVALTSPVSADGSVSVPNQRGLWLARVVLPTGERTVKVTVN